MRMRLDSLAVIFTMKIPFRALNNARPRGTANPMLLTDTDRRHSQPIEVRGITKRYGAVVALDRIDVSVARGEFLTLLGPSGSGKTTLLMVLAGFVRAQSGSIRVGGEEIIRMPPHKRNIGIVFQNYALFPHLSVGENVGYPLRLRNARRAERERRVS